MDEHLSKPFTRDDLRRVLEQWLTVSTELPEEPVEAASALSASS
jgi:hypothetical protein